MEELWLVGHWKEGRGMSRETGGWMIKTFIWFRLYYFYRIQFHEHTVCKEHELDAQSSQSVMSPLITNMILFVNKSSFLRCKFIINYDILCSTWEYLR